MSRNIPSYSLYIHSAYTDNQEAYETTVRNLGEMIAILAGAIASEDTTRILNTAFMSSKDLCRGLTRVDGPNTTTNSAGSSSNSDSLSEFKNLRKITSMHAKKVDIAHATIEKDISKIASMMMSEMSFGLSSLANGTPVNAVMCLTEAALRFEQLSAAQTIYNEVKTDPSTAVEYGVKCTVIRCDEGNIERARTLCENSSIVIQRPGNNGGIVATLDTDNGPQDILLTKEDFIVKIKDDIRIVDETTLKDEYVWKE